MAVAWYLNVFEVIEFNENDVTIITYEEAKRLNRISRRGGFHVFLAVDNVPDEKTLYLKSVYLVEFGNRVWRESDTLDFIRTKGNEDDRALKQLVVGYLLRKYQYAVEPEEVHFITAKERRKFEELAA